jgi:hypothetical protein
MIYIIKKIQETRDVGKYDLDEKKSQTMDIDLEI